MNSMVFNIITIWISSNPLKSQNSLKSQIAGSVLITLSCICQASPQQEIVKNLREGQLGQAAKLVAAERKSNPKDVDAWFLEGVIQAQSGQTDKAIATFTQITRAHPQHAESYNNLGVLAAAKGQLAEARAYFEKALQTNPSYAAVHKNLGDVNSQLAKSAYGKALLLDSKNKPAAVQLSMLASTSAFVPAEAAPVATTAPGKPSTAAAPVKTDTAAPTTEPAKVTPPPVIAAAAPFTPVAATAAITKVKTPPTPVSNTAESAANDEADRKQVEDALRTWAKAWSRKDMDQYLATYATSFDPPGKMNRKAWEEERRIRIVGKRSIQVDLSQFRIRIKGTQAQAQFVQQYDSDSFKGRSTKTLFLVKEKGRWLISSESAKPL